MKRMIVQRNKAGKAIARRVIKSGESPTDVLLNMLLCKDIVLLDGDSIAVESEDVA